MRGVLVRPFSLSRVFAAVGLVSIATLSLASAVLLRAALTKVVIARRVAPWRSRNFNALIHMDCFASLAMTLWKA